MDTNQPKNASSPFTAPPTSQSETPKKKFPKWLVILIIVLLLGISGVLTYENYQFKKQSVEKNQFRLQQQ